jgi:basic membrane protein A
MNYQSRLNIFKFTFILLIVAALASCKKDVVSTKLKIGLVSAEVGFGDNGYNDLALEGLNQAGADLGVTTESYNCTDTNDIKSGINYFIQNNFDVIFCLSYGAKYSVLQAAKANPTKKFILLDDTISNPPSNVKCFVYQVDQASFLCGFLGAYWAEKKDPANPVCSWVGGVQIPVIEQFKTGYLSGIAYYNSSYSKNVIANGNYTNSFSDTVAGSNIATGLINAGADVVFPFAGECGLGALRATKAAGKWGIGVDLDQYISAPKVSSILLSSCLKKINITIYNETKKFRDNGWNSSGNFTTGLATDDVGYAPFHDYETQIADSIKIKLVSIKAGLINGTIDTGW